jgi:uncharacterized membrane protein
MNVFAKPSSKEKKIYTAMLLLSLAALFVTGILISVHLQPAETGSFCNLDDYWNCDRINKSIFAELFGIPVSYLGFGFYGFLILLLIGLLKGFDFEGKLRPFASRFLLGAATLFSSAGAIYLLIAETPLLGNLAAFGVIKNLLFVVFYLMICKKYYRDSSPRTVFTAFLAILTLFGVNFSLYLTDIELFVLEGICVFCLTQQVLIIFIACLNLLALKQKSNGTNSIST